MVEKKSPEAEPPHTYECVECGTRTTAESQPLECPDCGAWLRNLSKPRT
ncbi:MAG: rubrerythrin-like domain-containing protein [Haloferacaceae archaeon]